jgi:glycosyltransferase involved in cell wall biosynthesis
MSVTYLENDGHTSVPPENVIPARVAILMCSKNGAAFINAQLKSIAEQTHENWILIISDDGSSDDTVARLKRFAEDHPQKVGIRKGPGNGVCANFLSLANDPSIDADYFAFSDQDDVWYPDKLRRAVACLTRLLSNVPGMYCGRTELMDLHEKSYGLSPLFLRPPAFQNALVESLGGGNTMMFNRAAKKILEEAATVAVVVHDWWIYQIVSAAGGVVYYDPEPMLKYRQHSDNVIGSNTSWGARLVGFRDVLTGRWEGWNQTNITALQKLPAHLITPTNREVLDIFIKARRVSLFKRLYLLKKSGIYRQTLFGNLAMWVAALLRRI